VKESDLDAEKIAALLAGKLGETERAAALERLASSGDDFRLFMETAAVLREIEEEEAPREEAGEPLEPAYAADAAVGSGEAAPAPADDPPHEPGSSGRGDPRAAPPLHTPPSAAPRWRRRRVALWIAPVLAGAAAVIVLLLVRRRSPDTADLTAPVALLSRPGLSAGAADDHPWSHTLGTPAALAPTARAARAGALHTELALALRARDAAAAAQVVAQLETVLSGDALTRPTANVYRNAARAAADDPRRAAALLAQAGEGAAGVLDAEWMQAGAWAEAGWIAAADHDEAFFAAPAFRAELDRIGRLPGIGGRARGASEQVRAQVQAGAPYRWDTLKAGMRGLLAALAS